jgi:thiol-disulfide isomerase/thioredoxin
MKKLIFSILILLWGGLAAAQEKIEIDFFYGESCPHCAAEHKFLDELEKEHPEIEINRYSFSDSQNQELLKGLCEQCGAERYFGLVPLTFIDQEFFLGFDDGIGQEIENFILGQIPNNKINFPLIGEIDPRSYSLPVLAVILGFLDGFNICSLGALVLILGLVLVLRSRVKILFFGGIFVLTTAIVYGVLIGLWYKFFSFLAPHLRLMEILIGFLGIGGGLYFLRQFFKIKKRGPVCESGPGKGTAEKFSFKIKEALRGEKNVIFVAGIVLLFAAVITVVEFPCSAVVPVIFAGILVKSGLSAIHYFSYIALFIIFYMLDEIFVFLVAVFKMNLWLTSRKFVLWITLVEAIVLLFFGFYYLI